LAHSRLGYNYRISDINCALGIAQLERIEEILKKREKVAVRYNELLGGIVKLPETIGDIKRSWFVYVVCLPEKYSQDERNKLLAELGKRRIGCNNYFPPIHLQPFYRDTFGYQKGDYPITESISERTIALPFHNNLSDEDIRFIVEPLFEIVK
jgi:perosamine synthetase